MEKIGYEELRWSQDMIYQKYCGITHCLFVESDYLLLSHDQNYALVLVVAECKIFDYGICMVCVNLQFDRVLEYSECPMRTWLSWVLRLKTKMSARNWKGKVRVQVELPSPTTSTAPISTNTSPSENVKLIVPLEILLSVTDSVLGKVREAIQFDERLPKGNSKLELNIKRKVQNALDQALMKYYEDRIDQSGLFLLFKILYVNSLQQELMKPRHAFDCKY